MNEKPERWNRHRRPNWWPENEPWPPERFFHRRHRRGPFHFRIGCLIPMFFLLAGLGCSIVFLLSFFQTGRLGDISHWIVFLVPLFLLAAFLLMLGGAVVYRFRRIRHSFGSDILIPDCCTDHQ